ncbi:MAG: precorrin-2 C(20)-methyltransferase [Firmicutes bacterium]|nr:precorrin-2 C(20)-methyltransferase [Bacillota bacterium]
MGILYGIGVGPGDAESLTAKAIKALQVSTVVFVPVSKAERQSIALQAAEKYLPENVRVVELLFPMTRDGRLLAQHWQKAAKQVAQTLQKHQIASFLTIGDPLLYSTFGYLMRKLKELDPTVKIEIIPGISAINAAASLIQLPLVEKDERIAIIPAPVAKDEFAALARYFDTVVFLKVSAAYDEILDLIIENGFDRQTYLVSRVGGEEEFWSNDPFAYRGQAVDYLSLIIAKRSREK